MSLTTSCIGRVGINPLPGSDNAGDRAVNPLYIGKAIPVGLFAACTEVTSFSHAFKSCTALTTVPVGIFDNNRKVKSFSQTFHNCSSWAGESPYTEIEGVKYHLYERANNFTEFVKPGGSYCFEKCSKLTDYKSIPSDWK